MGPLSTNPNNARQSARALGLLIIALDDIAGSYNPNHDSQPDDDANGRASDN